MEKANCTVMQGDIAGYQMTGKHSVNITSLGDKRVTQLVSGTKLGCFKTFLGQTQVGLLTHATILKLNLSQVLNRWKTYSSNKFRKIHFPILIH